MPFSAVAGLVWYRAASRRKRSAAAAASAGDKSSLGTSQGNGSSAGGGKTYAAPQLQLGTAVQVQQPAVQPWAQQASEPYMAAGAAGLAGYGSYGRPPLPPSRLSGAASRQQPWPGAASRGGTDLLSTSQGGELMFPFDQGGSYLPSDQVGVSLVCRHGVQRQHHKAASELAC